MRLKFYFKIIDEILGSTNSDISVFTWIYENCQNIENN